MTAGTPVHLLRDLPAQPSRVWSALTGTDHLSLWFTPTRRTPDGVYELTFHEDDGEYTKRFVIGACSRGKDRALRSFHGRLEDPGYPDSTVSLRLWPHGSGTRLELTHHDPPPSLAEGYSTGWAEYLDALAQHLDR
ncbi:SRPBCC domain-containing protein [Kineosporia sp. NBRC 101731]|uniref:SRPBCC family protein n=1 Tax=Kineosporia sp. NBRC 101731 TaxID=3032199 RepID=UPI0024A3F7B8|nr:SRPBCC domain-containing protein [Kineosporia sp. NBRC 101731]GLY30385.1 hypothetical protein Kisp02_37500 [Kineosporia sp. NBRC 101731]